MVAAKLGGEATMAGRKVIVPRARRATAGRRNRESRVRLRLGCCARWVKPPSTSVTMAVILTKGPRKGQTRKCRELGISPCGYGGIPCLAAHLASV